MLTIWFLLGLFALINAGCLPVQVTLSQNPTICNQNPLLSMTATVTSGNPGSLGSVSWYFTKGAATTVINAVGLNYDFDGTAGTYTVVAMTFPKNCLGGIYTSAPIVVSFGCNEQNIPGPSIGIMKLKPFSNYTLVNLRLFSVGGGGAGGTGSGLLYVPGGSPAFHPGGGGGGGQAGGLAISDAKLISDLAPSYSYFIMAGQPAGVGGAGWYGPGPGVGGSATDATNFPPLLCATRVVNWSFPGTTIDVYAGAGGKAGTSGGTGGAGGTGISGGSSGASGSGPYGGAGGAAASGSINPYLYGKGGDGGNAGLGGGPGLSDGQNGALGTRGGIMAIYT